MVTHDDLARRVDRAILIADGEVVQEHPARALKEIIMRNILVKFFQNVQFPPDTTALLLTTALENVPYSHAIIGATIEPAQSAA